MNTCSCIKRRPLADQLLNITFTLTSVALYCPMHFVQCLPEKQCTANHTIKANNKLQTCPLFLLMCFWRRSTTENILWTLLHMMTSSNGNIFRVTGYLCGDFPESFVKWRWCVFDFRATMLVGPTQFSYAATSEALYFTRCYLKMYLTGTIYFFSIILKGYLKRLVILSIAKQPIIHYQNNFWMHFTPTPILLMLK